MSCGQVQSFFLLCRGGPSCYCFSVALVCSAAAFAASREALTSSTNCSFYFCCVSSLVASFCLCIVASSHVARFGVHYSGIHESRTTKTTSSIDMNESLVYFCSRSFCALIYTLCISTLKSAKLRRLSYIMGDRRSYLWIHVRMLASMSIYKILISWMRMACLVAQSDTYFTTSGKSWSRGGN